MITIDNVYSKCEYFYKPSPMISPILSRNMMQEVVPQSMFLSQLNPEGHLILNEIWYPDPRKSVTVNEANKSYFPGRAIGDIVNTVKHIERITIPFQQIVLTKDLTHVCGNRMNLDVMELSLTEIQEEAFIKFRQKWILYNFDTAVYEFCKSIFATGDAAMCLYRDEEKRTTSYKVFSILDLDELHPIFDYNGKLRVFGRSYYLNDVNANNDGAIFLEIWDDQYYYMFSSNSEYTGEKTSLPMWDEKNNYMINEISYKNSGWNIIKKIRHGFTSVPVVYCKKKDGACWSLIQRLIESLEKALSELFENNKTYAFRIMYIQGGFQIQGSMDDNGINPKVIMLDDPNAKAGYIDGADASGAFKEQWDQTINLLKMCGFVVFPPESLSGDTSGTAIKVLYAPAIEKAINNIHFLTPFISSIVDKFKEGISLESDMSVSDLNTIHIHGYLTPFIPQNDQEVVSNLSTAYSGGGGYLSAKTCQEKDPNCVPQEAMRVKQQKEEDAQSERNSIVGNSDVKTSGAGMNTENIQRQQVSNATNQ